MLNLEGRRSILPRADVSTSFVTNIQKITLKSTTDRNMGDLNRFSLSIRCNIAGFVGGFLLEQYSVVHNRNAP